MSFREYNGNTKDPGSQFILIRDDYQYYFMVALEQSYL